jgi:DNA polymerase eta
VFIDLSLLARDKLLERFPFLKTAPSDPNTPLPPPPDFTWSAESGHVLPADACPPPSDDLAEDEQETEEPATWHDWMLRMGAEAVAEARRAVHDDVGYTTSGGIARNKALAKLVASYRKPASQTVLRDRAIPAYLAALPFQKVRFLGGKLGETIAEHYKVTTVGELL